MMFFSRTRSLQLSVVAHLDLADGPPHLLGVGVHDRGDVDAVLGEDR